MGDLVAMGDSPLDTDFGVESGAGELEEELFPDIGEAADEEAILDQISERMKRGVEFVQQICGKFGFHVARKCWKRLCGGAARRRGRRKTQSQLASHDRALIAALTDGGFAHCRLCVLLLGRAIDETKKICSAKTISPVGKLLQKSAASLLPSVHANTCPCEHVTYNPARVHLS